MAELITTEEERECKSYLEWSDEALGKLVKKLAVNVYGNSQKDHSAAFTAALGYIACDIARTGVPVTEILIKGVTERDKAFGDWKITIERINTSDQSQDLI